VSGKRRLWVVLGAACLVLAPLAWHGAKKAPSVPVVDTTADVASPLGVEQKGVVALEPHALGDTEARAEAGPKTTDTPEALPEAKPGVENPTWALVREIEGAAERSDTSKLAGLLSRRLDADPEASAPLIRTIGHLAALAPAREKDRAATTLAKWLDEQTRESSTFARGNVSLLVDALADTGSLTAVEPLVRLLDTGSLAIHLATRTVEALTALGDGRARGAIVRFANRVDAFVIDEGLPSDELRAEAREATRRALESLPENG
jgi:hypothetical protein